MRKAFLASIHERRSIYEIGGASPIPNDKIIALLEMILEDTPSAFNSQSARICVLFEQAHLDFWKIVLEEICPLVTEELLVPTEERIAGFAAGYGTILFYDDTAVVTSFSAKNPLYANKFPIWAEQANAMLQFNIWTALADEGLGASLQHYNPVIDEKVKEKFNIPDSYRLIAQMPFGVPLAKPIEKVTIPGIDRMRVML